MLALPEDCGIALVVEDDAIDLTGWVELLAGCGLRVRLATTQGAVLSALGGDVDVVIANVQFAGVGAAELLEAIRAREAALPIFFITGWPTCRTEIVALCGALSIAATSHRIGRRVRRPTASPLRGEL